MDYTISEVFELPSKGKIYETEVKPLVRLRAMTTDDEMRRLAPSDRQYQTICNVIDACIVDDIGISSYDMCLGDFQFLLHKLRVVTYGADYRATMTCPFCGYADDRTINLESLEILPYSEEVEKYLNFELPKTKHHIKLKMQTPRLLDEIQIQAKDLRKKAPDIGDTAFLLSVQLSIAEIDHKKPSVVTIMDFVRNLPMMDTNYIIKASQAINEKVGLVNEVSNTCPVCGLDYSNTFRITGEFFGPSIDA